MVGVGIRLGLLELARMVRVWFSLAAPEPIPESGTECWAVFCGNVTLASALRVGASFTGFTVTRNERLVRLFWLCPSFTLTVMRALPLALGTGVKLREPLAFGLR